MESLLAHIARKERDRLAWKVDVDERPDLAERFRGQCRRWRSCGTRRRGSRARDAPRIESMLEPHLARAVAV